MVAVPTPVLVTVAVVMPSALVGAGWLMTTPGKSLVNETGTLATLTPATWPMSKRTVAIDKPSAGTDAGEIWIVAPVTTALVVSDDTTQAQLRVIKIAPMRCIIRLDWLMQASMRENGVE